MGSKFHTTVCRQCFGQNELRCQCHFGFLTDIDECARDLDNCSQICNNTEGSYNCSCRDGFVLLSDDITCEDINECLPDDPCPGNFECNNTIGSYHCYCPEVGFIHANDDCADIDECALSLDDCAHNCSNTIGSYKCYCMDGYQLDPAHNKTCNDIDECKDSQLNSCNERMTCQNDVGSYNCECKEGYIGIDESSSFDCEDSNECQTGANRCNQTCTNTEGSYECSCHAGFYLTDDGVSCGEGGLSKILFPLCE